MTNVNWRYMSSSLYKINKRIAFCRTMFQITGYFEKPEASSRLRKYFENKIIKTCERLNSRIIDYRFVHCSFTCYVLIKSFPNVEIVKCSHRHFTRASISVWLYLRSKNSKLACNASEQE